MFSKQIGRGQAKYHLENIQYAPQIQMNPQKVVKHQPQPGGE